MSHHTDNGGGPPGGVHPPIISHPKMRAGRWTINGTRLWPWLLAERVAAGDTVEDVADAYGLHTSAVEAACVLYRIRAGSVTLHVEAPVADAERGLPVVYGAEEAGGLAALLVFTAQDGAGAVVLDAKRRVWQAVECNGVTWLRRHTSSRSVDVCRLVRRPDLFPMTVLWGGAGLGGEPKDRECATDAPDGATVEAQRIARAVAILEAADGPAVQALRKRLLDVLR
ncbi:MAG: DUF433 domain-containing protein [Myxococcales bacterium]|nr:DUF433 domain-containing protein [Myxococcales bacterium]